MPKPNPKDSENTISRRDPKSRHKNQSPPAGMGSVLLFWPFLMFHWSIRNLPAFIRLPVRFAGDCGLAAVYGIVFLIVFYGLRARPYDMNLVAEMPERSVIYDRRGEELGRLHGEKRDIIRYTQISPNFLAAILSREDKRFLDHRGVDWIGVGRAVFQNIKRRGMAQGASTITMQLTRNTFLDLKTSLLAFSPKLQELDRKLIEAAVSYRIESNYSKEEILTHYVNRIFWGHSIRGIEEASRTYFEKHASELTLSEAALLAGIVRGPNAFSPFRDVDLARHERDTTLDSMLQLQVISQADADAAKAEPINIRPESRRIIHETYAMDAVRRELEQILEQENINLGGLFITTTIDNLIQTRAEQALDNRLRQLERTQGYAHQTRSRWKEFPADGKPQPEYIQGSVVVIENLTGAVLGIVGGRDADESKFNRALQARRQVGSIFKPFVYLAAFDRGMGPDTPVSDGPLQPGEIRGASGWHPHNSDGTFGGEFPASYGLIRSRNTMSIRVGNRAGIEKVSDIAADVGFETKIPARPASYLGAWEASPMEVASAYTVFPNQGQRYRPYLISEIRDHQGNVLYRTKPTGYRAAGAGSTAAISRILSEVTRSGTAASVRTMGFTRPCAGKTGTTNDFRDAWFAGFTSSVTCAVWVGLDKPAKTIQGGYGATLALPVWAEVMKTADKLGYKAGGLKSELSFTDCRLCRTSGKRATPFCEHAGTAYTDQVPADKMPAASDLCTVHTDDRSSPVAGSSGGEPPRAESADDDESEKKDDAPRALPADE